jgi:hypothetical protein
MPSCPACGKGITAATKKCPACGKEIAAPPPKPDSYDLLPEEPKKKEEEGPPSPAPSGGKGAPPNESHTRTRVPGLALASHEARTTKTQESLFELTKGTVIGGVIVLLALVFFTFKMCRTEYKVEGRTKQPVLQERPVRAGGAITDSFVVKGGATFEFEVAPVDGDVLAGVLKRDPKGSVNPEALKGITVPESLAPVSKGSSKTFEGELPPGTYSWVVLNEGKKPVKVKIKYLAKVK